MKYTLAADARPQVNLLLAATLISVGLWVVSWFLPFFGYSFLRPLSTKAATRLLPS